MPNINSSSYTVGPSDFEAFRDGMGETCDLGLPVDRQCFEAYCRVTNLGTAILSEMRSCSLNYYRRGTHIARGGYSHLQLNLNLAGRSVFNVGRRSTVLDPGDIGLLDTLLPVDTYVQAGDERRACSLALFLPASSVACFLPHTDSAHGTLVSGQSRAGAQLAQEIIELRRTVRASTAADAEARIRRIVALLEAALDVRWPAPGALLGAVKRFIDSSLDEPIALSIEALCRRFACSRAALYRIFEADGGIVGYIRGRRLQRAFLVLLSATPAARVIDVATRSHFASEATFNRAFRRTFGIPPGELRDLAHRSSIGDRRHRPVGQAARP